MVCMSSPCEAARAEIVGDVSPLDDRAEIFARVFRRGRGLNGSTGERYVAALGLQQFADEPAGARPEDFFAPPEKIGLGFLNCRFGWLIIRQCSRNFFG